MIFRKFLLLAVLLMGCRMVFAQYTTTHYIAPSPWSYFSKYNELVVTTLSTTPVAVTIASSNGTIYSNSSTTVAGTPLRYRFTATDANYNASGVVLTGQGLYVTASSPIGVQVRNIASDNYTYGGSGPGDLTSCVQKGNSAFTSLGDQGLGTSFRLGYYANVTGQTCYSGETGAPLYSVLAISNSTNIYVNGILLKTLSAGQSYIFQASLGSILTSNNNVAVNSGMRGDNSSGCADGVESQIIPVSNLGTTYVVVRSNGNTGYEKSTIVATQALTTVTVKVPSTGATNTYLLTLAGDYVTINNGDGATAYTTNYITTTAPVAVYTGSADGCEIDMIVQPPLSNCSGSFDVQTSQFLSNTNDGNKVLPYFGYIVIQSDTAIVYFNGTNLESIVGNRTQIGTSGFYIIKYTSTQLGNPSNLRFVVNARINAALIESGAGYSMSAFISSISNAMPPPSASSTCLPTTFTAQGGFTTYQWYKDGVAVSGATSQTYSPSVSGSYSVTGTTANCGTTAQSTAVLVNPKPNAGSDVVSCAGKAVTLTATSTITGGSWLQQASNPTGATLSNTANNVSTATFTNAASGTYNFIFSVGCSDTMSVTINPLPTVAAITGTTSVCIGSTTTLADATTGGVWSSATTSVATINSSGVVTSVSAGTSVISYTVTNANGCVTTVTTTVTVNALPIVAAITGTTNVCVGSTTTLADATTGGVWSSATTSVATVNSSGVVTGVSAGTSVISYTVTNANGCVTTVTTTVTVNALPTIAAITGTINVCVGSTTTLADATTGGVWSSATTSVATVNSSGIVTGVSAGTSVISYTVTNGNGCVSSVNIIITVNALPTVAAITGTTSICAGTTTTLADATVGGVWSSATTSVATVNSSGVVTGVSAGTSVISYTVTNANNCSASTTKTFTVNAQPVVAAITGTSSVCIGSGTITLGNTTSGGTWSSSVTSVATISSSGVVTSVAPGTTTINYTVNGSGGCSTTQSLVFVVKATSTSTTNASICSGTSYTFNGTVYTTAGTYVAHLTNAVGCDSAATLNLTVKATSTSTTNASICSGTTYTFNGTTYTTAGTYVAHLTNAVGCDSAATLVLAVKATSTSTTNASICSGTTYTFNGTTYAAAGTYVAHLTNAVGCDSAATLVLTVKATSTSTTNASICSGTSYTFNGTTYSTVGTYVAHLTNAVGCDSAATLNLAVKATSTSTTNISICPTALPYVWNSLTFNAAGTYVAHLTNSVGCDSAATLNLTVKVTSTSTTNASICSGTTYTFNGTTYSTAGTYVAHLTNAVGCDSAATLVLTVKATSASTTNISICPTSLPYVWNGLMFNASGTQTAHLTNTVSCDSAATLNLTVKATSASTTNVSICPTGLPYVWNNLTFNATGTQTAHLTNSVGCDSAATLNLTVKATSTSTTNASICSGTTYTFNGTTYTTAGTYVAHLTNAVGCDSAATLNLTVKATSTSTTNASICSGTTYTFNGTTYTTAGTYVAHLTNAVGCDSAATLVLTVKATSTSTTNASICSGTTYAFNGTTYSTAGTYVAHLTNAVGCDSAATLVLTVKATSVSTTNISICPTGLPYLWNGLTFNAAGTQTAHLINAVGCDSAATLNLTVKATSTSTTNASICSGTTYTFNGTAYSTAGTYVAHLTNTVGCDSAATLVLAVKATSTSNTNASICSGTSYTFNGTTYTTAGTYVAHLTNAVGCDSAATLVLTVKSTSTSTTNISICSGTTYTFNGTAYTTAGTYVAHLTNTVGCDSAATLVLTVKATSASTTNISICPTALPYVWNGLTFNVAGTQTAHLTNAVGCDSAATLVLTVKATSTSTTNISICSGTSYTFNGTAYTTAGTYVAHLTNSVGCDSAATLNLTVKATSTSTTNASICSGTTYTFNGTTYTTAGTYVAHLTNAVGCDSAASLNLTVKATSTSTTNASICSGTSYTFNGTAYTTAGTYVAHLTNAVGCDSAATLNLTVKSTSTSITNVSICSGTTYTFNGTTYSTAGTYVAHLTNAVGCDSAATLNLTVKATSTSTTNISICPTALPYVWNSLTFNAAGTKTAHLINAVGCDSAATLNLTVKATSTSTTNASICSGTSYTFNGTSYTTAGTYVAHLTNAVGCDSAATLNLTVKATSTSTTNISICPTALPYVWNGLTFNTAGTQTAHLTNAVGCDSAATLVLTVKATSTSTTNISICSGTTYTFNGTTYSTAGTYVAHLTNAVGCDSAATLNLAVKATSTSTTNISICPTALPYIWNGLTFNAAGTQIAHLANAIGCDSAATLVLTVKAASTSNTNASICSGTTYTFNGTTYSTAGTYVAHLTNAVGCDSAATLVLTVKATSSSTTNISICPTVLPYVWNGLTFNVAGTQTAHLTNAVGCDSAATLVLTVKATSASTTNISICPTSLPYIWNGLTFNASGTQTAHLTNTVSCDSAATLNLTVKATSASTTNISICSGTNYTFNGTAYSTAGTYVAHLTNAVGCDSAATLVLTVKSTSTSTTNISICSGTTYTFNGTTYSTAGTYVAHLTNAVGCDSAATLVLTVKSTSTSTTNASICSGTSYTFNGTTYTTAGTYVAHLTNAVGCDSAATLVLTVKSTSTSTTNVSICSGTTYTFNGTTYTTAGTYVAHLTNAVGCDSAATLVLTVKATSISTTNISICPTGLPYLWNGLTFNAAGTQTAHLTNAVGCDSAATLNLTVKATSASTTNISICSGTTYTFNGTTYGTAGTYIAHLTNAVGCDSAATLNLTVKATSTSTTNISICPTALPYVWNSLTFNASGTQTAHLTNAVGCDSAATLVLVVKATSTSTTNISICPTGLPYLWNGLTFNASGTQTAHLTNAVGCDSAATLVLTVKATSTSTTNASICSGTSYTFNGTTYTTAGTYVAHLTNAVGCDSAATLNLTVKATSTSTTNASICSGTTYTFNGTTYSTAGTYVAHLTNTVSCDSAATLNLTVKATSASTTNVSICPTGLPYVWNNLTFNATGTQTAHLTNSVGCDSAATLNLTVKATSTSTTNASICSGTTYTFNGTTYTTAGTYVAHLTNAVGCDSAATLNLAILYPSSSINSMSICPSALPFIWNGVTFTGAGTQTAHILNVAGCDSAATLILTVKAALTSTTNATICGGNSYMFNGTVYTTSGTYVAYLASGLGCDSIATLNLTVAPKPNAGADKIIGFNNGNASVTLSGIGSGVWIEQAGNTGTSTIVSPTNANTVVKNFSAVGTYNYIYVYGACADTMKVSVNPNGNISSYVWVDTNEDGINNESSTNGINNVTVELYKDDGTGNFTLAETTVTATNNGMPGYYNFIIPETGNYKVKFPLVAQDGGLTTQNLSTNYSNTSVADPATGFSPVVAINTTGSGSALNNTSIGAGYKYVAAPNCNMTANIGYNQLSQCVTNNQYNFTGNFTGGTAPFTYLWDLNDGTYATTNNVSHTYATAGDHDVTFIVKDSRGCEAHASTVQIHIGAKPKASLDIYTHSGNGDGFTFVSTSTISGGWMNFDWDLGNGTTSTLVNPMTTYALGTYTIKFIATGNFGCSDTLTKVITVDSSNNYCSAPTAKFTVNNDSQCLVGNAFTFTNNSTGTPINYIWNFGDGSAVVTTQNATYSYATSGTYNVALTATNACGSNTVTKQITINDLPSAPAIITGPSTVTVGSIMLLSNATTGGVWSSSNTAVATINNYGIVTGVSVGTTNITYSISNGCGTSSVSLPITVTPIATACTIPVANFSINNATQCLVGNAFVFANNSTGTTLNYTWNFGDASGLVNAIAANHSYAVAGTYTVSLTASNNCGINTITNTVTVNTIPAQPLAITGANAIVSGATSTLSSVTVGGVWSSNNTAVATVNANGLVTAIAAGNTVITYTVSNTCGTASVTKTITVTAACVPTVSTTTASICAGNSYSFNGSSYTTAGTYTAHLTNAAGCDSAASLILIIKQPTASTTTASICAGNSYSFNGSSYTTAGNYVVHLTNAAGCDSAATLVLTVNSLPVQPQAITGNTNLVVSATTTLSSVTTGGVWMSNNTAVATVNANGLVTGISAGTAVITYTVSNGCGSASVTTNVTVTSVIIPCNVAANFTVNNLQQCVTNNQFVFTNTTTGGTAPFTYLWHLSDGTTDITKDVTKIFATYGEHDIALQVTDSKGCVSNAASQHITIGAKPSASFTVLDNTNNGQSKTFISASTVALGPINYLWDLGNGTTSTLVNPSVTYAPGTYNVSLTVTGWGTCKDVATQTVVQSLATAALSIYPNPVVNSVQVSFTAASNTQTVIKIVDAQGRVLQMQTVVPVASGVNVLANLNTSGLQNGIFTVYISDVQNGFIASKQIIKQ